MSKWVPLLSGEESKRLDWLEHLPLTQQATKSGTHLDIGHSLLDIGHSSPADGGTRPNTASQLSKHTLQQCQPKNITTSCIKNCSKA